VKCEGEKLQETEFSTRSQAGGETEKNPGYPRIIWIFLLDILTPSPEKNSVPQKNAKKY
jgi:hypothetical protein